jgi:RHS repeat-associated protein
MAGAIDHPLDVIRVGGYGDVIVPVYNWRGTVVSGVCVQGSSFCTDFTWPAQAMDAFLDGPPPNTDPVHGGPVAWGGNLIDTQQDGSGLVYKRNRYYDPASGRFTQVDPIGLAGGLSAYGFAGGDPVSFVDPFGLDGQNVPSASQIVGDYLSNLADKALALGSSLKDLAVGVAKEVAINVALAAVTEGVGNVERAEIKLTEEAAEHIAERHTVGGAKTAGKSIFKVGEDLHALAKAAEGAEEIKSGNRIVRVVDAGREVGIDRVTGKATQTYTVVTDANNSVRTMHPGLPH